MNSEAAVEFPLRGSSLDTYRQNHGWYESGIKIHLLPFPFLHPLNPQGIEKTEKKFSISLSASVQLFPLYRHIHHQNLPRFWFGLHYLCQCRKIFSLTVVGHPNQGHGTSSS